MKSQFCSLDQEVQAAFLGFMRQSAYGIVSLFSLILILGLLQLALALGIRILLWLFGAPRSK